MSDTIETGFPRLCFCAYCNKNCHDKAAQLERENAELRKLVEQLKYRTNYNHRL